MSEYQLVFPDMSSLPNTVRDFPFCRAVGEWDTNETWAQLKSLNYAEMYHDNVVTPEYQPKMWFEGANLAGRLRALTRLDIGFLLEGNLPPIGWTATAASLALEVDTYTSSHIGGISTADLSMVLVAMDESIVPVAFQDEFSTHDYTAISGSLVELSDRIYIPSAGSSPVWTFNAAGIAYLNTVRTKTNFPDIARFGMAFVLDVLDNDPTLTDDEAEVICVFKRQEDVTTSQRPTFNMTYTPSVLLNVGDVWKDVTDIQINVGDTWKSIADADDIQINVGDDWKGLV